MIDNQFNAEEQTKEKLTNHNNEKLSSNLNFEVLSRIAIFRYGGITPFAQKMGITRGRATQILKGYPDEIPKKPEIIKRWAEALDVDIVILTQLFDSVRSDKISFLNEVEKNGSI